MLYHVAEIWVTFWTVYEHLVNYFSMEFSCSGFRLSWWIRDFYKSYLMKNCSKKCLYLLYLGSHCDIWRFQNWQLLMLANDLLIVLYSITKAVKRRVSTMYFYMYKQPLDNVYTQVAIHRFTLGSLVVHWSLSSPPQSWISTLAREYWANLTLWLMDAEPIFSPYNCFPTRFSLSLSLSSLDW